MKEGEGEQGGKRVPFDERRWGGGEKGDERVSEWDAQEERKNCLGFLADRSSSEVWERGCGSSFSRTTIARLLWRYYSRSRESFMLLIDSRVLKPSSYFLHLSRLRPIQKLRLGDSIAILALVRRYSYDTEKIHFIESKWIKTLPSHTKSWYKIVFITSLLIQNSFRRIQMCFHGISVWIFL